MSPRLGLQFLGLPQLCLNDQPAAASRRKAIALLAYLAVNGSEHGFQPYSRETLSGLFWPEHEQARAFSNLRTVVWEARQALGEGWLIPGRDAISLNGRADIRVDVVLFRNLLLQSRRQNRPEQRIPLLVEAAKLYRDHFLAGFSLRDTYAFNEWAYMEAADLRRQLSGALQTLSDDYSATGEAESAIPYARRLVALDRLDEASHRKLVEVYIQAGKQEAALEQYQTLEKIVRTELGLDPAPETLALYERIRMRPARWQPTGKPPHNLPAQLSTFIGREKDIDQAADLLKRHRLVTLTGTGGIGKTRLSLQVGEKLLDRYTGGVWFLALDSLSDPDLVLQALASVFGLRETPGRPLLEELASVLRERQALLILDNCEHVLQACVRLAVPLLAKCPELAILATSREVLNITGEATYQVPALAIPAGEELSLSQLSGYEAVRLFLDRAALALPSFSLTGENARAVLEICRKLDGIPRAIELAAARVNMLQVTEIRDQLQRSFALLSTDDPTPLRQQTLQASLDWSWNLLTDAEQKFMRRLAVFAGGWTLETARAIGATNVLGLTRLLVKKSLLVVDQGSGGTTRYRFHEIVRQYARQKVSEAGEDYEALTSSAARETRSGATAQPARLWESHRAAE